MSRAQLLKIATGLVSTHGFTRQALAQSVLALPTDTAHPEPLSNTAVSALFGNGDDARRTLINAWLDEGLADMGTIPSPTLRNVLHARLRYNEPAVPHLSEAFALLASSNVIPLLDPVPALKHVSRIANEACLLTHDKSIQLEWYSQRATLAAVYGAAELHQITSPHTAYAFLDTLLDQSSKLHNAAGEVGVFSSYIFKSWKGIAKSKGLI
ncbi:hypothetical protein BDZ89DRAFT_1100113 [Hymenopellis radicata]|nr:hypothetical protein BDZ89DRAFT_1100113 [Hymenopellis radicata]